MSQRISPFAHPSCVMLPAFVLGMAVAATPAAAESWPNWRGPSLDGTAKGSGYATTWSPTENIRWRVALPGLGASTPAVWGDRLVVTCGVKGQAKEEGKEEAKDQDGERDAAICFGLDGKERWSRTLGPMRAGKHKKATGCNPSPITDGRFVWVYFKSGELACLNLSDGAVEWKTNLQERFGKDTLWWDLGTSPVLGEKALIVAVIQTGPSYLIAFDRATGEVLWKHDRLLDSPEESAQSYSTPVVVRGDPDKGEPAEMIVVLGADHVTAHDTADGRELWRVGGLNPEGQRMFRSIASPVVTDDLVIAPYARGNSLTAIRRGGTGDVTASHVAWTRSDLGSDVPSPAVKDGRIVVCGDKGRLACVDATTGKTLWEGDLPKNRNGFSASPVIVDGRVLVTREDGETIAIAWPDAGTDPPAGDSKALKTVGGGTVGEMTVATPVCVDGRIFLRTHDSVWCIGAK